MKHNDHWLSFAPVASNSDKHGQSTPESTIQGRILDAIRQHPGINRRELRATVAGSNTDKDDAIDELLAGGRILCQEKGRSMLYRAA